MLTIPTRAWPRAAACMAAALALSLACASAAAAGKKPGASCSVVKGGSATALAAAEGAVRRDDRLFRFLKQRYGAPSACRGSGQFAGEGWVEFTWPDKAVFKTEWMEPEISIASYSRPQGLRDKAVVAAFRSYAAARGMRINWDAPRIEHGDSGRVEEFQAPDPGRNGIARLMYSPAGQLVGLSLSSAP